MSGFVNETERQAALHCQQHLREARGYLIRAAYAAADAGFGDMLINEIGDIKAAIEQLVMTYELD